MKEKFILIGGWSRTKNSYNDLICGAPKNYEIFFVNYLSLNPKDLVLSLFNLLEEEKLGKYSLIGHSLGGAIAIKFCYQHPEMVKKLYLINSEGVFGEEKFFELIWAFLFQNKLYAKRKLWINLNSALNLLCHPLINLRYASFAYRANLIKEVRQIKAPTSIFWGEKDSLTPLWQGKIIKRLIPNSKLEVISDMDHDWLLHSPEKFWNIVNR